VGWWSHRPWSWRCVDSGRWFQDCGGPGAVESCARRSRLPGDGPRNSGATHPHTTHESSSTVIHYRHHPFHGEAVEIIRRLRRSTSDCVVVKLRDEVQIAVPAWMLDPVCCQQFNDEAQPRIAVSALCELRALIDSQSWLATPCRGETGPGAPQATGGDDARPQRGSSDATDPDIRPP
jgi:hypothetical protein